MQNRPGIFWPFEFSTNDVLILFCYETSLFEFIKSAGDIVLMYHQVLITRTKQNVCKSIRRDIKCIIL